MRIPTGTLSPENLQKMPVEAIDAKCRHHFDIELLLVVWKDECFLHFQGSPKALVSSSRSNCFSSIISAHYWWIRETSSLHSNQCSGTWLHNCLHWKYHNRWSFKISLLLYVHYIQSLSCMDNSNSFLLRGQNTFNNFSFFQLTIWSELYQLLWRNNHMNDIYFTFSFEAYFAGDHQFVLMKPPQLTEARLHEQCVLMLCNTRRYYEEFTCFMMIWDETRLWMYINCTKSLTKCTK